MRNIKDDLNTLSAEAEGKPIRSRHSVREPASKVFPGISIYKTHASPYWFARVRDPRTHKNIVRSTKERNKVPAKQVAFELASELLSKPAMPAKPDASFALYADRMLTKTRQMVSAGTRNQNYVRTLASILQNGEWGLLSTFGSLEVEEIRTRHWTKYLENLAGRVQKLSPSTVNSIAATFRNVMKVARDEGAVDDIPPTPVPEQRDNPRPFFQFHPLVSRENDEYRKLLEAAKQMAQEEFAIRGVPVTDELYDLILFVTHTFVRPTTTELYALRHRDIQIAEEPKRLLLTIRNGKTGFRIANSMEAAVSVYKRICQRYPEAKGEDFLFLPAYANRETASRIFARQFNQALGRTGLKSDAGGAKQTVYSLRHTAICMRIIKSHGAVNIYNLAKNAGTSVDQIERFYAKNLPLSAEMARNLQSFGDSG